MKKLLNIILLFGLILNISGQDKSSITRDIVRANDELYIEGVDFKGWLEDSTSSATARDAGSGMSLDGNNIDFGGTLTKSTSTLGAGYPISFGTAGSRLSAFSAYASGNLTLNAQGNAIIAANGTAWTLNGTYFISSTGDTLASLPEVRTLIEDSKPLLPFNFQYVFSATTTDSRPGQGVFRLNNGTLSNVTQIYVDYFDYDNISKSDYLQLTDTETYISIITDVNNYAIYQVVSYVDASNYYKYNVTYLSHNGVISGLSTIDLEIKNTTGGGGGGAIDSLYHKDSQTWITNDTIPLSDSNKYSFESTLMITDTTYTKLILFNGEDILIGDENYPPPNVDYQNVIIGGRAGISNTDGDGLVGLGTFVLNANTTGYGNTAIGGYTLSVNTTGYENTGIGRSVLRDNISGDENSGFGAYSLWETLGSNNSGFGAYSLEGNTSGFGNIGIGYASGRHSATTHNQLFINSIDRDNYEGDTTESIIYGIQDVDVNNQRLYLNAQTTTKALIVDSIGFADGSGYISRIDTTGYLEVDSLSIGGGDVLTSSDAISLKEAVESETFDIIQTEKIINGLTTISSISYTTTTNDYYLHVDYTSTDTVMITIDDNNKISGANLLVKDADGNAAVNNIRIIPESGTIDGESQWLINGDYDRLKIYSDGTNWFVID